MAWDKYLFARKKHVYNEIWVPPEPDFLSIKIGLQLELKGYGKGLHPYKTGREGGCIAVEFDSNKIPADIILSAAKGIGYERLED